MRGQAACPVMGSGECGQRVVVLDMSQSVTNAPRRAMSKLLLIEDDDETAVEVVGELTHRGYLVERAATGMAAIQKGRKGDHGFVYPNRVPPGNGGPATSEEVGAEQQPPPGCGEGGRAAR